MEIGSSSSSPTPDYDVFLSFRGTDTRQGFVDFLYAALKDAGLSVFRDEGLVTGEGMVDSFMDVIERSKVCLPIFSRGYASSRWCLRELKSMVELKKKIFPVFYDVEPSVLSLRTGPYVNDLRKHTAEAEEVARWEEALIYVSRLSGFVLKNYYGFVEVCSSIIREIMNELKVKTKTVPDYLVGMENQVEKVLKLLDVETDDVRYVGIHGMGGIGKTTLAKVVFNKLYDQFDCCSFLDVVHVKSLYPGDLHLQQQLLKDLQQKSGFSYISDIGEGISRIMQLLMYKKVLIVLDGVDRVEQIDVLAGSYSWLHSGSRIIITTRNKAILPVAVRSYEVKPLDDDQALQLFSMYAFRNQSLPSDYRSLSHEVVKAAGGQPLLLEIIGSQLYNRSLEYWGNTIMQLKRTPDMDLKAKLRASWAALDFRLKHIFLDISCFLLNKDKTDAIYMWEACNYDPHYFLEELFSMSSMRILDDKFHMHDSLRDFGREMVYEESDDPSKRSRLWIHEEALSIIEKAKGSHKVKALRLSTEERLTNWCFTRENLEPLENLLFLECCGLNIKGDLTGVFSELRWLSWHSCPVKFEATNLNLEKLVILDLSYSGIDEMWDGWSQIKIGSSLKSLNLTGCERLKTTPDLSALKSLERLILNGCSQLTEIDSSLCLLRCLKHLDLTGCKNLRRTPNFSNLRSLERLILTGCTRLTKSTNPVYNLKRLKYLDFTGCTLLKTTPNLSNFKYLERLTLNGCSDLTEIDFSFGMLKRLKHLSLRGCTSLRSLPNNLVGLDALEEIFVEGNSDGTFTLPETVGHLKGLKVLEISYVRLTELPPSIGNLEKLEELALIGCGEFKLPYSLGYLTSLVKLDISHCEEINELPDSIGNLKELKVLIIRETGITQLPSSIGELENLEELDAAISKLKGALPVEMEHLLSLRSLNLSYTLIEVLPSLSNLSHLQTLYLGLCDMLVELPDLPTSLVNLEVTSKAVQKIPNISKLNCIEQVTWHCPKTDRPAQFPSSLSRLILGELNLKQNVPCISHLRNLRHLKLVNCSSTDDLWRLGVGDLKSLRTLEIVNCDLRKLSCYCLPKDLERLCLKQCGSLKIIHNLSHLKKMEQLEIDSCKSLFRISTLEVLKYLQRIKIINCPSLGKLADKMVEPLYYVERPVGADQVEAVKELLDVEAGGVLIVGIHGVGGIGKTTLARVVFNQLSPLFQECSFLRDIGQTSRCKGLKHLMNQLLRDIPDFDYDKRTKTMKDRYFKKKVLIVLDDVDQRRQINRLVGKSSWFGSGSRIIVTTQDINVVAVEDEGQNELMLKWPKEVRKYEMRELNDKEAIQLFCGYAFPNDSPPYDNQTIHHNIVEALRKLPLAIEIVGSIFNHRPKKSKGGFLEKLINESHYGFQEKLMLCYDDLEEKTKQIFLDVAFYFNGKEKVLPSYMWESCGFLPDQGIDALLGMHWIKIIDGKFWMHDQIRKLGMEIVHRESSVVPTIRSRLWGHEEVLEILTEHKGKRVEKQKEKVKALSLCCEKFICEHTFTQEEFGSLPKLCFLELYGVQFSGDFENSLPELRWLSWHFCPQDFGATNLHLEKLVILDLSRSPISDEWGGLMQLKMAKHLKVLNLTSCKHLIRTPDLSGYKDLERLILEDCENLGELHKSIGKLEQLKYLNLRGCNSLKELPDEICYLKDLNEIVLKGDGKAFRLPKLIGCLTGLLVLEIANVHINELPPSIGDLERLQHLSLSACTGMKQLPDSLGGLSSLTNLDLSRTEITELPNSIGKLKELKVMRLDASSIRQLPCCIGKLDNLEELYARCCRDLQGGIPGEIGRLSKLRILDLSFTRISSLPTTVSQLSLLEALHLDSCNELYKLPPVPPSLVSLRVKSQMLQHLPDLLELNDLVDLQLSYASSKVLIRFPTSIREWINSVFAADVPLFPSSLSRLSLYHLEVNKLLPNLSRLKKLTILELYSCIIKEERGDNVGMGELGYVEHLSAHKCMLSRLDGYCLPKKLRVLCISECKLLIEICGLSRLENLLHLEVTGCKKLIEIDGLGQMESLEEVIIGNCSSLVKLGGDLSKLKRLESLQISRCENLIQVEGLNKLESVKHFEISRCRSLESMAVENRQRQKPHMTITALIVLVCFYFCGILLLLRWSLLSFIHQGAAD